MTPHRLQAGAAATPAASSPSPALAIWMLFIESKPWPTLTLIVSLGAIFLSAFVIIGQNRQAAFQQG